MLKKLGLPALIMGAMLALSPATGLAAERGEHGGNRGGAIGHSQQHFSGGHERHFENRGHNDRDNRYRGYYYGGRPALSFGFYGAPYAYGVAPYAYGPNYCGSYDQWGAWVPSPGCYGTPYGY
jgi:hypothetical protein